MVMVFIVLLKLSAGKGKASIKLSPLTWFNSSVNYVKIK